MLSNDNLWLLLNETSLPVKPSDDVLNKVKLIIEAYRLIGNDDPFEHCNFRDFILLLLFFRTALIGKNKVERKTFCRSILDIAKFRNIKPELEYKLETILDHEISDYVSIEYENPKPIPVYPLDFPYKNYYQNTEFDCFLSLNFFGQEKVKQIVPELFVSTQKNNEVKPHDETKGSWVSLSKAAKFFKLKTGTLADYRNKGNKDNNNLFGKDSQGHFWRKKANSNTTEYWIPNK
jgi:hypothetical protein